MSDEAALHEKRREPRRPLEVPITMRVDSPVLGGTTDNVSGVGVMFFAEEPLRVQVEFEEDGRRRVLSGRLVRTQKMSDAITGFAVEFDPV